MVRNRHNLITDILTVPWALEPSHAHALLPTVHKLIQNADDVAYEPKEKKPSTKYFIIGAGNVTSAAAISARTNLVDAKPADQKIVAVIPIKDVITKYDAFCGPRGTQTIARWISEASDDPNVSAIILDIDSPGGAGNAMQYINEVIQNVSKPVLAYMGDGLTASAAYGIGCNADECYATYETDMIGSIGTYITLMDFKKYFESQGMPVHEIYATLSTEKNIEFRNAMKGEYETIIKNLLNPFNEYFINTVKSARPQVKEEAFKGKVYYANEAVEMGLIDGLKTFDEVVQRAVELASSSDNNTSTNSNSNHMSLLGKNKFKAVASLAETKTDDRTQEQLDAANAELKTNGLDAELVSTDDLKEMRSAQENLQSAKTEASTAKTDLTNEKNAHLATKKELENAQARIAELESLAATNKIPLKNGKDDVEGNNENATGFESNADVKLKELKAEMGLK